jgi:Ser/Thr protein kinase RdoA (MazF antagonist)
MDITVADVEKCIRQYRILDTVVGIKVLADGPDHIVPYDVIRKIIRVDYGKRRSQVIKFVREPIFSKEIIERQCEFSDLLQEKGFMVPDRWKVGNDYCISYQKSGLSMVVTLEEWLSDSVEHMTRDIFASVAGLLGDMHRMSLKERFTIGFSLLYKEVTEKDTSYEPLWRGLDHSFISEKEYGKLLEIYNRRIMNLKSAWTKLPRAAVQGDIYSCNNLAWKNGRLAVFDFNLAGDEVLIGDLLLCWFRTVFDERIKQDLEKVDLKKMWNIFLGEYHKRRKLMDIERKVFSDIYAILGVLHFTKLLVHKIATGRKEEAMAQYPYILRLLQTSDEILWPITR